MNKTLLVIFAIVLLGGAWYFFAHPQGGTQGNSPVATTTTPVSTSTQQTTVTPKVTPTGTATKKVAVPAKISGVSPLAYLLGLKQNLICNVSTTGAVKRSGTMYIANTQMRANFGSSAMIDDGEYLYSWLAGATKGLKLRASSSASGSAIASNGGIDPLADLSYSCNTWAPDMSLLVPPTAISFSNTL